MKDVNARHEGNWDCFHVPYPSDCLRALQNDAVHGHQHFGILESGKFDMLKKWNDQSIQDFECNLRCNSRTTISLPCFYKSGDGLVFKVLQPTEFDNKVKNHCEQGLLNNLKQWIQNKVPFLTLENRRGRHICHLDSKYTCGLQT